MDAIESAFDAEKVYVSRFMDRFDLVGKAVEQDQDCHWGF